MAVVVVGLSHRTASVEVRERVAIPAAGLRDALEALKQVAGIREGIVLSTCNRTEVYAETEEPERDAARLQQFLADSTKTPLEDLGRFLYVHREREAVRHVFRVAASLDSMVIGESQILGQVKSAFAAAQAAGAARSALGRLMDRAFATAKRVRSETAIGEQPASVGSAAADLARTIFGELRGRTVLLVGAGKMGRLTLRHLRSAGVESVWIANRTAERAEELLRGASAGQVLPLERALEALEQVDIALSSIQTGRHLLDRDGALALLRRRRNRPLFLVDIAVPRSIDPRVNEVENVFLYDIDDLQGVVAAGLKSRAGEAARAERVVEAEAAAFLASLEELDVVPAIRQLLARLESLRGAELERHLGSRGDLTAEAREAIEQATRALVAKIAHGPIQELKRTVGAAHGAETFRALRRALLGDPGKGDGEGGPR